MQQSSFHCAKYFVTLVQWLGYSLTACVRLIYLQAMCFVKMLYHFVYTCATNVQVNGPPKCIDFSLLHMYICCRKISIFISWGHYRSCNLLVHFNFQLYLNQGQVEQPRARELSRDKIYTSFSEIQTSRPRPPLIRDKTCIINPYNFEPGNCPPIKVLFLLTCFRIFGRIYHNRPYRALSRSTKLSLLIECNGVQLNYFDRQT